MRRDSGEQGLDPDLVSRLAGIPAGGQRWLKTALVTIRDFEDAVRGDEPPPRVPEPVVEEEQPKRRAPVDLEEVISGRARLDEQLEAYPELADELEGLSDVIDLLREAGQARRRKGEDVLRELGLAPPEAEGDETEEQEDRGGG